MTKSTALVGPNLSGRSRWLADRRAHGDWRTIAFVGPHAETALTGLAWRTRDELELAATGAANLLSSSEVFDLIGSEEILARELHVLSGGELVRVAIASALLRRTKEIQVDVALEQLDSHWRQTVLAALLKADDASDSTLFVCDNRLSTEEAGCFDTTVHFPPNDRLKVEAMKCATIDRLPHLSPPPHPTPIRLDNLCFSYPKTPVFKDISLTLNSGQLYILTGPNGSGKTTLVRLLSGTLLPQDGGIFYGDRQFKPHRSKRRYSAIAFQNPDYQWTALSVAREFQLVPSGRNASAVHQRELLSLFGIPSHCWEENAFELPFVLKKRLTLALAVLAERPWLILDEPTLGQDRAFCAHLIRLVQLLLTKGFGIILITHHEEFKTAFSSAITLSISNHKITFTS